MIPVSLRRAALCGAPRLALLVTAVVGCTTTRSTTHTTTDAGIAATSASAAPRAPEPAPILVAYVVRHAERADTTRDPSLSEAGRIRAAALAAALRHAGVAAVVTTQYARTRETAAPLATSLGLEMQVVAASSPVAAHADSVARAVERLRARGAVLVVGHSNTVPAIVAALGGPRVPDLCDANYDELFVVVRRDGEPARMARASFGDADDDEACAAMTPL